MPGAVFFHGAVPVSLIAERARSSGCGTFAMESRIAMVALDRVGLHTRLWRTHGLQADASIEFVAWWKVVLGPGQSSTVELVLDKYAVSSWYERLNCWVVEKGTYTLSVGGASDRLSLSASLDVPQVLEWKGL